MEPLSRAFWSARAFGMEAGIMAVARPSDARGFRTFLNCFHT